MAHKDKIEVRDCEHRNFEKKVGNYYMDGYIKKEDRKDGNNNQDLAVEIHGLAYLLQFPIPNMLRCFYHACKLHYPDDDQVVLGGRTAGKIRERNEKRESTIREIGRNDNFELKVVWECEIREELEHDAEMKKFFDNCFSGGAITLRDGLSGGRTEVFEMIAEADDYWALGFIDVVSLYPCKRLLCRHISLL